MTDYNKSGKNATEPKKIEDDRPIYQVVSKKMLNFREAPGGNVIFPLKIGEKIRYTGAIEEYDGENWRSIEARGKQGWVMEKYIDVL